jgi:hypothetical protein
LKATYEIALQRKDISPRIDHGNLPPVLAITGENLVINDPRDAFSLIVIDEVAHWAHLEDVMLPIAAEILGKAQPARLSARSRPHCCGVRERATR